MAASYTYLGVRGPVTGVADTTGFNTGNWTIAFTPAILNFTVPEAFVYKMNVKGALGTSFNLMIDNQLHDVNLYGNQNSWYDDGDDSILLRPSQTFYVLYSDPTTDNTPPIAWLYLRYDLQKWGSNYG